MMIIPKLDHGPSKTPYKLNSVGIPCRNPKVGKQEGKKNKTPHLTMLPILFEVINRDNLPTLYVVFLCLLLECSEPLLSLIFLAQKRLQCCLRFGGESVGPRKEVRS